LASQVIDLEKSLTPEPGLPRKVVVFRGSPEEAALDELRSKRDEAYQRYIELEVVYIEALKAHHD
jgi:hypothetical protein